MSEWQPIDTAPRDGTEFLAWDAVARKMDVAHMVQTKRHPDVWWCEAVQEDAEYGPLPDDFGYRTEQITHWRPLPPEPQLT